MDSLPPRCSSSIKSLNKYLYLVIVLGARNTAMNKTDKNLYLHGAYILVEKVSNKQNN